MMNFKIENNYLNITNYPYIERHFEDMAGKGWLIIKIIMGNLFIYKKIKPEKLDFSISPYEVETAFTRKTKEELEEFKTVCENVGWNYATKSYDLHVYFKEKESEALPIQTDEEEEFKTLELLGKKQLKAQYWLIPLYTLLAWINIGKSLASVYGMRDGLIQIVSLIIPAGIILGSFNVIELRKFLKVNRQNVELGKDIEFNDSKFYGYKICFTFFYIFVLGFVIYLLYAAIILRKTVLLFALIPILIGLSVGFIYRVFVKPSRKSISYKKIVLVLAILSATVISIGAGILNIGALGDSESRLNIDGYRVLSINDFIDTDSEDDGYFRRNISFLIPESYEYSSYVRGHGVIDTEYSNALSVGIAKNLVNRYKNEAENRIIGRNSQELEFMFENGIFDLFLVGNALTEKEFNNLRSKDTKGAVDEALEIIKQRSIVEDKNNIWDMDEVYFLSYDKSEIVIRNGNEVFFLGGEDFSNPDVIEIVKNRLELN